VISDQLNHEDIILFRKIEDEKRGFRTITYQIPSDFWIKHDIEEFKYYQFYRYRNSEFFFSRHVIIVESKTEAEIIKSLLEMFKIDLNGAGISIIDLDGVRNIKYPYYLLKYLNIPHLIIVDKDFFIPYYSDELKLSRDTYGFPKYKYQFSDESFIKDLIPNERDRNKLLRLLKENHSKAMDLLGKYNIICFNYSTEIDLISSDTARNEYFRILDIPESKRTKQELLIERRKQIKKIEHILEVLKNTPRRSLPNPYKRIIRVSKEKFKFKY